MARVPPVREKLFASEDQIHHVVDRTTFFAAEAIRVAVLPLRAPQTVDVSVSDPASPYIYDGGQRQWQWQWQGFLPGTTWRASFQTLRRWWSRLFKLHPERRRALTTSRWPWRTARCAGVESRESCTSTLTPAFRSALTTSRCPCAVQ